MVRRGRSMALHWLELVGPAAMEVDQEEVDTFVKNAHHLRVLRGKPLGAFDKDRGAIGETSLAVMLLQGSDPCPLSERAHDAAARDGYTFGLVCVVFVTGQGRRCIPIFR